MKSEKINHRFAEKYKAFQEKERVPHNEYNFSAEKSIRKINQGGRKMDKQAIMERFAAREIDILYRQLKGNKNWTGWKSFRKTCREGNPPWPWNYPCSVEWKTKEESR